MKTNCVLMLVLLGTALGSGLTAAEPWQQYIVSSETNLSNPHHARHRLKLACYHSLAAKSWYGVYESWVLLSEIKGTAPAYFNSYLHRAVSLATDTRDLTGMDLLTGCLIRSAATNRAAATAKALVNESIRSTNLYRAIRGAVYLAQCGEQEQAIQLLVRICRLGLAQAQPWETLQAAEELHRLGITPAAHHWLNRTARYAASRNEQELLNSCAAQLDKTGATADAGYWRKFRSKSR